MSKTTQQRRKRRRALYTKGDKNRLVDSIVHPLIEQDLIFILLDELGHGLVEGNLEETIMKFVRYRGPEIVRELLGLGSRKQR